MLAFPTKRLEIKFSLSYLQYHNFHALSLQQNIRSLKFYQILITFFIASKMPPPPIPRETRSQKRSRAGSDGPESVEASSSTRKPAPRRKPDVRPKPTSNYGAVDSQAPAQKQAAKAAKREATDRIEAGVGAAIDSATITTTKGLTSVAEEDERSTEDDVSSEEEETSVFNREGESEGMDDHIFSDLTGSKSFGREAQDLNDLLNRQPVRASSANPQRPTAPNLDAISTQPVHQNQRNVPLPPQAPIQPALTNSPVTALSSRGETHIPWIWKWMWLALLISLIVSVSTAGLSTLRYRQMTTGLQEFQNEGKVSSIIPAMFGQRLDKLEGQVARLAENAVNKDAPSRQINWLSFDLGARANPFLSSPCARRPYLTIKTRWSLRWKHLKSALSSQPHNLPLVTHRSPSTLGPNTALTPWTEFEPRYCAPSGRGKLQLAVNTPRPITPTVLVVEHFRRDLVPFIGSAPKEVELWIEIGDRDLREELGQRIKDIYPDIFSRTYTQKDRLLDPKMALGPEWVPVGRWTYQISARNNVQHFQIPVDLNSLGVVVQKQVIRVNSNWGNVDRTCLVRVRLHGEDPSAPTEYLEDMVLDEDY